MSHVQQHLHYEITFQSLLDISLTHHYQYHLQSLSYNDFYHRYNYWNIPGKEILELVQLREMYGLDLHDGKYKIQSTIQRKLNWDLEST